MRGAWDLRPRSGQTARQRGAGAQGGARTEQGRPGPRSAARHPLTRGRQGRRPPRPVRRERATPSTPGGGLREPRLRSARPLDHLHPGCSGLAASRVPGTLAYLGTSADALSRAGARRWWPLRRGGRTEREPWQGRSAGGLDSFTASTPRRQPHAGTLPPAQPPPPGGRPPLRVTHQEHTPRQRPSLQLAHTPPITPPWVLYPLTRTF